MKLDYKKVMLVGLSFFVINMFWAVCNITVPVYLKGFGVTGLIIGLIMALDNVFAVVFQPIFGILSDKTSTPYGKRMPYLLVGIPMAAICFFLISLLKHSLTPLILMVALLGFFISVFRTPTLGLMYDLIPENQRCRAHRITSLLGAGGAGVALLLGGLLFDKAAYYPFGIIAFLALVAIIVMYSLLREPTGSSDHGMDTADAKPAGPKGQTLSLVFLLLAVFFWFTAFSPVETFFSVFVGEELHGGMNTSFFLFMTFSLFLLISAIPSELLARRVGRKNAVLYGIIVLAAAFAGMAFVRATGLFFLFMGIAGIGWAVMNMNAYTLVYELSSEKRIGKYTNYYYILSMVASILSPILSGFLRDRLGNTFLFIYCFVAAIFSFFFMMLVQYGDRRDETMEVVDQMDQAG